MKRKKTNGLKWNRGREEGILNVMALQFPLQYMLLIFIKIQDPLFYWIVLQDACKLKEN